MRLIPLEVGRLDVDMLELVGVPGRQVLPVPAWLIDHPQGLVLFDTGLHVELRTSAERLKGAFAGSLVELPIGSDLTARLAGVDVRPSDVKTVILSHLHFDHCGGTAELPDARLVVQREEWDAGHHPRLVESGLYNPDDFEVGHAVTLIDGTHDVFGDGRIVCVPTPGHTKGHQSLRVELGSGPVVLTADCVYFRSMLDEMRIPTFAYRSDVQLASMRHLAGLERDGCRLLFGHDVEQLGALPLSGLE